MIQKLIKTFCLCFIGVLQVTNAQTISFSPSSGERGSSFGVTVTGIGTSFIASSGILTSCVQIFASPSLLQLTGVNVVNSTTLTGTLNIPMGHSAGVYDGRAYRGNDCAGDQYNCTDCFTIVKPACLTVVNTGSTGSGSLRAAFGCAIDGDTIRFNPTLNNSMIALNLPVIANDKDVLLYSDLSNNITISSLQLIGNTTPFISTTGTLSIWGLKLQGNTPESLILKIEPGGSIDLNDCEVNLVTIDKN
jgi:hypothetical protein